MDIANKNIESLGYGLETAGDGKAIERLLDACGLKKLEEDPRAEGTQYLTATTPAGGVAAMVGWSRYGDGRAVIHSLAVAPSSRGIGIGASMVGSAMTYLREEAQVEAIYVGVAGGLWRYFGRLGFEEVKTGGTLPPSIKEHPSIGREGARVMSRDYGATRRGLDQCAFILRYNSTAGATLPTGSVFWFRQRDDVVEAQYRGGRVRRGHMLGALDSDSIRFSWHACDDRGGLQRGQGRINVEVLDDGRRELREVMDVGELLLREI